MAIEAHDPGFPWWVTSNPNNPHYGGGSAPEIERPRTVLDPALPVPAVETEAEAPVESTPKRGRAVLEAGNLPSVPEPEPVAAPVEPGEPGRLGS